MFRIVIAALLLLSTVEKIAAQTCAGFGHTPSSAILLCGSVAFTESEVPTCGESTIPVPCNGSFRNSNATWYKINCFASGTLGFTISPLEFGDNYDWQLFDISGRNDDDVFRDASLFVACNWSPDAGQTGASSDGISTTICQEAGASAFSEMPQIVVGHEYLLLVSQRSNSTQGFQIEVSGGSADITDPGEPGLSSIAANCDGTKLTVILNKRMLCNTIAADGSDFQLDRGASITSAVATDCVNGEGNTIVLTLSQPLPAGDYTFSMKNGTDGNTIVDHCRRSIGIGDQLTLTVSTVLETPLQRIVEPACSPSTLRLICRRNIRCNSIASDGSDFILSGPQTATITGFTSNCNGGPNPITATANIDLILSSPLVVGGTYRVTIRTGSDGNTLIDECGIVVTADQYLEFTVSDTVNANFRYSVDASCTNNVVTFVHAGRNAITEWNWSFDAAPASHGQTTTVSFPASGQYHTQLIVSNGVCKDTSAEVLTFDNRIEAAFDVSAVNCPEDLIAVTNNSSGDIDTWKWEFGDGTLSEVRTPDGFKYAATGLESDYLIRLIASSSALGCSDTMSRKVKVLSSCYIAVPSAFTPNGDGLNDLLFPVNALRADKLVFRVYNRNGQLVYETKDWTRGWNGRVNGKLQDVGVFAWTLQYLQHDTGKPVAMKGTTLLLK